MKDSDHGELTPDLLLHAYTSGIFPMSEHRDDPEIFWVEPRRRGVFPLDGFHISRSLARALRRDDYRIAINRDFAGTLDGCAAREETWISARIADLYMQLHDSGFAHSFEVWSPENRLIGGVYGVALGGAFFGESMFSRRRDASKIALAWLVAHLNRSGFQLFDTQFLTPHLATLGAQEISRAAYRAQLAEALTQPASFTAQPLPVSGHEVVQLNTQMS
ncbi:leucyl/phenylalanyl-tRNA--protein transferase [Pseudooceanicola nitratireducens]|jgi:leucyl/phenylalanyl-tRNA--protein transferase|uniref:Leucyl/phenylalanyl-tRNA--protein transferase n=1 Tax=Pseudooceanicola nitratireducens TaxID=517719 RepID=A0A1I1KL46_9RHOB|nr:leucyl/phenylalanyl-tRNA--protein transferase [Pseudooceanicola nitratireducens]SEJ44902.1 leucyl/phenylalanyl-tRNA--protein transferase [Pseudooceanicola nitratireducens]SFC60992.1 leucyl/phenylalanyl-tRNA--protein transferase [Pseudooceanicola nitratireducens]